MTKRTLGVLAIAIIASAAGCSDSDKDSATATTTTAPSVTTAAPSPSFTGDKDSRFCQLGAEFARRFQDIGASLSSGVERARTELTALRNVVDDAAAAAPADLKSDVAVLATTFTQFFSEAEAGGFQPNAIAAAGSKLTGTEVQTAVGRLEQYGTQVCGIKAGG